MKGLLEFLWGCVLICAFAFICTHIGLVPAIFFGMLVGLFFAAAHDR